ncbi:DUF1320 domain-containing protein [Brevinema andersonii]|uniref:DUF1320 domain-containing protein n=1 Tax=Brevinema andersonii TaxID=34097 RepID=UPI00135632E1|nr:DUF1320 domain-containing protein [Brevinema andersonii]
MYCSQEDLYEACKSSAIEGWARDLSTESKEIINHRIQSAIMRATDEMNLYLVKIENFPLPVVPRSLRDICVKLSLYSLMSRKGLTEGSSDNTIKINRDTALKQLEMIALGKLDLGLSIENTPMPSVENKVSSHFPPNKMKPGNQGW